MVRFRLWSWCKNLQILQSQLDMCCTPRTLEGKNMWSTITSAGHLEYWFEKEKEEEIRPGFFLLFTNTCQQFSNTDNSTPSNNSNGKWLEVTWEAETLSFTWQIRKEKTWCFPCPVRISWRGKYSSYCKKYTYHARVWNSWWLVKQIEEGSKGFSPALEAHITSNSGKMVIRFILHCYLDFESVGLRAQTNLKNCTLISQSNFGCQSQHRY
jgi:hypothetical protein